MLYFVYHYATDYYYDNGIIIGASTNKKECERIVKENKQLTQSMGFKNGTYKIVSYEPTDNFTYL